MVLRRTRRRAIGDAIETSAFGCRRYQIEAEFLANDAGEKAAHRVLLPSRGMHHGIDGYATRHAEHRQDAALLGFGAFRWLHRRWMRLRLGASLRLNQFVRGRLRCCVTLLGYLAAA